VSDLLVDVTQFARQPARSGVQRALGEMARAWPADASTAFVARIGGELLGVAPRRFADVVDGYFSSGGPRAAEQVRAGFEGGRRLRAADQDSAVWLLPEPTYDPEILDDLVGRSERGERVGAVVFDCFPQTHPGAFAGNGHAATSPYFRLLGRLPVAVATSAEVGETLVGRLRRDPAATPVAWLGTDHVAARPSSGARDTARFLMVGTVEPRKRFDLGLDAVAELRERVPAARLVVAGRPGWAEPAFLRRLRRASDEGDTVEWRDDADDAELVRLMGSATALLSLGDEGFGLPVVEAAKQGCPTVYGGVQPAAGLLEGRGAWRADTASAAALAAALEPWCDPAFATARAAEVDVSELPTWRSFSAAVLREVLGD
jgi:glycosyltransferase involved in cell wall biosynthesis